MSRETLLLSLDEHLSNGGLIKDFCLNLPEDIELNEDELNLASLFSAVSDLTTDFPNDKIHRFGSARFTVTKGIYKGKNFDYGGVTKSVVYLLDLAAQDAIEITFDGDPIETNKDLNSRDTLEIDFQSPESTENSEEKIPALATVHLPINFRESLQDSDPNRKITAYSKVFMNGYALDYLDRILTNNPFNLDAGLLQIGELLEEKSGLVDKAVMKAMEAGGHYGLRFREFYSTMLNLPDLR